jgi:SAM-dependent methyltransferase
VRWLLGDQPVRVVDVAAGTGILTRLLRSLGHDVTAVEPDESMLAVLRSHTPDVEAYVGQAESVPLPSGSVDAVVAAQAHWWFDPAGASREIGRVLRDGGRYGALWNGPDTRVPWAAGLQRIESGAPSVDVPPPELGAEFGPLESATFDHRVTHTEETLLELIRSRAYFITAPRETQARVEREVRELVAPLPATFDLPYVTYAVRATKRR